VSAAPAPAPDAPRLAARLLDVSVGGPEVFVRPEDAQAIGVRALDRVRVRVPGSGAEFPAVASVAAGFIQPGSVGLSRELADRMRIKAGAPLEVRPAPRPASVASTRRKLDGRELSAPEMAQVIHDIAAGHLTPVEIACWAAAVHTRGMSVDETAACVQAMVDGGERIAWDGQPCLDVHSIGGVPGNKYAPIAVSIAAACGLRVPKTSSRAISSACGTADFLEVLMPVALDARRLRAVALEVGATLAWGGAVSLAPADDEIIKVEYPLGIDPPAQLVASVLAKKVAMGVSKVLIDIPTGPGAKVQDARQAEAMADLFRQVGARLGLEVRCESTPGGRPVGRTVGPALEAREMLRVLETGDGPADLVAKATLLAGRLLEMGGKAEAGRGAEAARAALRSGAAHRKFLDVVRAQGGDPALASGRIRVGPLRFEARALAAGRLDLGNAALVAVARAAGAPHAKGAGVELLHEVGERIGAAQPAFVVYAETASRLASAWEAVQGLGPFSCAPLEPLP
jgi:AMP phosphorylase